MGSQAPLGKKDLFNTPGVELPGYIREIARALIRNGKDKSQAIQIAIGTVKRWAAGGGGVNADTKAKAAKALAEWEAAKAKARATPNKQDHSNPFDGVDLANATISAGMGMVALEVPEGTLTPVPGGVPADDMHVTLQFLGEDVSDTQLANAIRQAWSAASETGPLTGTLGGLGIFPPKDGKRAVWCPVDVPGLDRLKDYIGRTRSEHGWTPHVTLTFQPEGAALPGMVPQTPVTFTTMIVKRGDWTLRLPLGGDRASLDRAEQAYANLTLPESDVLLAQAPENQKKAPKKKDGEKPQGLPPGAVGYKHGWIPVDSSGKQVGPAQKPQWLKDAEAKHKAAGGKTYEQIQADKLKAEQKTRANKAAAPAKKAAAEAKHKKAEHDRAVKKAVHEKAQKAKQAERATAAKKKARDAQVAAAYKQAQADLKAGRTLSEQQRRVVAYVEANQRKEQGKLRRVDVKGVDGSKIPRTLAEKMTPAQRQALVAKAAEKKARETRKKAREAAFVVRHQARLVAEKKRAARYKVTSYAGGKARVTQHANEGVYTNVLDFAGHPKGQLAFRYKHGWILINPAIPSRGRMGGGIARQHGHKSGSVTHGHFEAHPSGKGKVFVPERSGGENNPVKLKAAHLKNKTAAPHEKSAYTTAAAQKDTGGSALKPTVPTTEHVSTVSKAAKDASTKAQQSKSLTDAQVAAKKHADAFVQAKKAGNTPLADAHKNLAQAWAKKANQIKQAEKASADAKKKYEAEQKAKAAEDRAKAEKAKADAEKAAAEKKEAEKKAAQDKAVDLVAKAQELEKLALDMPAKNGSQMAAKAQQYQHAADKYAELTAHMQAHGMPVGPVVKAKKKAAEFNAVDFANQAIEYKQKSKIANQLGNDAFDISETANMTDTPWAHKQAAKKHIEAGDMFKSIGLTGDQTMHYDKAAKHTKKAAELEAPPSAPSAPKVEAAPKIAEQNKKMAVSDAIGETIDELDDVPGTLSDWDDYLHAAYKAKATPSPSNTKLLVGEYKKMTAKGVTADDLQKANATLFKKTGLVQKPPAKKTVAEKKVITAEGVKTKKVITAEPKTSPPIPGFKAEDYAVTLPGPGMYKDGNAVTQAYKKAMAEDNPAKKAAMMQAADNAAAAFKAKHGKEFDKSKVEEISGGLNPVAPFVPQHGGHTSDHPFWKTAQDEGYEPIPTHVSANGTWKPSDVPGLKSNKGAYTYSGGSYTAINSHLRKGGDPKEGQYAASVAQMDKEFAAVPGLDKDIVTIRKMSNEGPFSKVPPYMEPGGVFEDKGYSSTSKDPGAWSGGVAMQIRIPKGSKVLDLNHTTGSQHSTEQEILLNRGSKYKVISDGPGHGGNGRLIVVELVQ